MNNYFKFTLYAIGIVVLLATSCANESPNTYLEKEAGFSYTPPDSWELRTLPGYKFKIVDAVITNFHTPCSTNLVLMASFMGLDLTKKSYSYAKDHSFRFFSFGDAMFIR